MTKPHPSYLKVFHEAPAEAPPPQTPLPSLDRLLQAFQRATGWSLRYAPQANDQSAQPWAPSADAAASSSTVGYLELDPAKSDAEAPGRIERTKAQGLAEALAALLGETLRLQHALWQREAELAAGVPVVLAGDKEPHLAARLEAVLKSGAEAIGCQAAALYLLDEATSALKLRACWGLPLSRLADPARPLRGALGDLEAMLGHAVVLDDETLMSAWRVPEKFAAAACVPVASADTILGTLWTFAAQPCAFNDAQTGILELTAGRIAADLQKEMLLQQGLESVRLKRQLAAAEQFQRDELPGTPLELEGWDLAGWTAAAGLSGEFFDWFALDDGRAATVVAQGCGSPLQAGLIAAAAKAALRSHSQHLCQPDRVLNAANRTLWTAAGGDQRAALYYGLLDGDRLHFSATGPLHLLQLDGSGWRSLQTSPAPAGEDPEATFPLQTLDLPAPGLLLVCTAGLLTASEKGGPSLLPRIAQVLQAHMHHSARQLAAMLREVWDDLTGSLASHDATVLLVKRLAP